MIRSMNSIGPRWAARVCACTAALLLAACGGGSQDDPAAQDSQAAAGTAKSSAGTAKPVSSRLVLPQGLPVTSTSKLDPRLRNSRGPVEVWVTLDQAAPAAVSAQRATDLGLPDGAGLRELRTAAARKTATAASARKTAPLDAGADAVAAQGTLDAIKADVLAQRQRVRAQQTELAGRLQSMGARELGRANVAHNAVAVRVDAAALPALAALPGVAKVRPVVHYQLDLSETVPYVGGAAVQARGFDGSGVKVAILDSGIDYTHRNLGGAGTPAAYEAAYGPGADGSLAASRDGLFPTAKVVEGFDFVGETWPNGDRTEDDDPIDFDGHGTHVADIVAGASVDGAHKGMAPGASLVAIRVCSAVAPSCNGVALVKGVEYALDPNGDGDFSDAVDVMNLSLGSNYGQPEDDLSFALGNAVKLGVVVVASAGNGGNRATITGSPASEPGVISVAQTQVPSAAAQALVINTPAALAGTYLNTASVDWAPLGAAATGDVAVVGRGCPAGSIAGAPEDPYLADPAGKIVLIDRGACSVSLKVDRAAQAGARGVLIGLVAPGDAVSFSFGGGSQFVPTLVITLQLSTSIKAQVAAGTAVNATLDAANAVSLLGSMASTSARGPSNQSNLIKPEIGAPGASLSAEVGTSTGETAFGGTSGAAPMVSGAVALLLQAHPTRSPMQVKAMLMNSAFREIFTNSVTEPGVAAPVTRIGAGELRVDRALGADLLAWNPKQSSAALSFGFRDVARADVVTQWLRIENLSRQWKQVRLDSTFRYDADRDSRAVRITVPGTVIVPPRGSISVPVVLTVDARKLPDWGIDGSDTVAAGPQLAANEYDGYITLRDQDRTLAVPWHVLPRKSSAVLAHGGRSATSPIHVANAGVADATAEVFALTGTSRSVPRNEVPEPGSNGALTDLRAVGARLVESGFVQFGVSTYGRRSNALYPAEFDILVDTNRDGTPDFLVFNTELGAPDAGTGLGVVAVLDLATGGAQAVALIDADMYSGNMILTVPLAALGMSDDSTFDFTVTTLDNYFGSANTDTIGPMTFTPSKPKFKVVGDVTQVIASGDRVTLRSQAVPGGAAASPSQLGHMLMYRGNAGSEADLIQVR
jgi:minor extracellular serine protease Vpr